METDGGQKLIQDPGQSFSLPKWFQTSSFIFSSSQSCNCHIDVKTRIQTGSNFNLFFAVTRQQHHPSLLPFSYFPSSAVQKEKAVVGLFYVSMKSPGVPDKPRGVNVPRGQSVFELLTVSTAGDQFRSSFHDRKGFPQQHTSVYHE